MIYIRHVSCFDFFFYRFVSFVETICHWRRSTHITPADDIIRKTGGASCKHTHMAVTVKQTAPSLVTPLSRTYYSFCDLSVIDYGNGTD